jgi:hypothetical protein
LTVRSLIEEILFADPETEWLHQELDRNFGPDIDFDRLSREKEDRLYRFVVLYYMVKHDILEVWKDPTGNWRFRMTEKGAIQEQDQFRDVMWLDIEANSDYFD